MRLVLFNLYWAMTLGLLSGCGYTGSYTCSTLCSVFVLGLPSLCSFSQACSVTFSSISFSPPLFVWSFAGHFDNMIVPHWQPPKLPSRTRWVHINYPLDLHWETWLWDCLEIHIYLFSVWGLLRPAPITFTKWVYCSASVFWHSGSLDAYGSAFCDLVTRPHPPWCCLDTTFSILFTRKALWPGQN